MASTPQPSTGGFATPLTTAPAPDPLTPADEKSLLLGVRDMMRGGPESWSDVTEMCTDWTGVSCHPAGTVASLNVSNRAMGGALPEQLSSLMGMERLDLSNNALEGVLPPQWSTLSNLTALNLDGNLLTGDLPEEWSAMSSLQSMNVTGNSISGLVPPSFGFDVAGVPEETRSLLPPAGQKSLLLDWLQAAGGTVPWWSATNMCSEWAGVTCNRVGSVATLNVAGQNMGGNLPASLSSLTSLRQMYMSDNNFAGSLPADWSTLTTLEYMDLSNNGLTGPLPQEWSAMGSMRGMKLIGNELSGTIPEEWSAMGSLQSSGLLVDLNSEAMSDSGLLLPGWAISVIATLCFVLLTAVVLWICCRPDKKPKKGTQV
mmetsp:Transcript_21207/g.53360  ORF Transcript_21207/g.53360 Transcript_21207/m.53360 type:complete len:372 (+) Transcript_21207:134-1249(+)